MAATPYGGQNISIIGNNIFTNTTNGINVANVNYLSTQLKGNNYQSNGTDVADSGTKTINDEFVGIVRFRAYRAAAFNSTSVTPVVIPFDTTSYDTNSNFDTVTNIGRYTAPVKGIYSFTATAGMATGATTRLFIALYKNGSEITRGVDTQFGASPTQIYSIVSDQVALNAGDYVEVDIYAATGGAVIVGSAFCYFSGNLVSR